MTDRQRAAYIKLAQLGARIQGYEITVRSKSDVHQDKQAGQ